VTNAIILVQPIGDQLGQLVLLSMVSVLCVDDLIDALPRPHHHHHPSLSSSYTATAFLCVFVRALPLLFSAESRAHASVGRLPLRDGQPPHSRALNQQKECIRAVHCAVRQTPFQHRFPFSSLASRDSWVVRFGQETRTPDICSGAARDRPARAASSSKAWPGLSTASIPISNIPLRQPMQL
jgi:hypothetical protein